MVGRGIAEDVAAGGPNVNAGAPNGALHSFAVGAVVVLSTMIVLALAGAVYGFVFRGHHAVPKAEAVDLPLAQPDTALPARSVIQQMQVSGDRLILELATERGQEIDIIDTKNGHLVARIAAPPPAAAPAPQP